MQEQDKWGIKGFTTLMTNFPDYASLVSGTDISTLGFDLNSGE
jgi:CCR4-NOT transcription complex subunit 2